MAQTLAGTLEVRPNLQYINALTDGTELLDSIGTSLKVTDTYANGTGSGGAQVMYHALRTLAATATDSLDLSGGLANGFGTISFTVLKSIWISVVTASASGVQVGGAASNALAGLFDNVNNFIKVGPLGQLYISSPVTGYTVTGSTADILKVYNPALSSISYKILLVGEGAVG